MVRAARAATFVVGGGTPARRLVHSRGGETGFTGLTPWSIGVQTRRQSSPGLAGWHSRACIALSVKTVRSARLVAVSTGAPPWHPAARSAIVPA